MIFSFIIDVLSSDFFLKGMLIAMSFISITRGMIPFPGKYKLTNFQKIITIPASVLLTLYATYLIFMKI